MFNLIKMDVYRLFRTKSFYVIGAILLAFIALMIYSINFMISNGSMKDINRDAVDFGNLLVNVFSNTIIPLLIGIGAAMFICADYSSGYIKNIASGVSSKANIAISKFITITISTILYFIVILIFVYLAASLVIGNVVFNDMSTVVQYIALSLFLNLVFVGLAVAASSIFRSSAASITTVVVVIMFAPLAFSLIKLVIDTDLSKYSAIMNIQMINTVDTADWGRAFISGLAALAIYLGGSIYAMLKRDIT